ncbi:leucine aminopeptidase [Colletotrichum truncatum]|uniref:Leucine aminopeptidase n=1 Tax=Colletotrichum truncatum TaxID=5467 RepID=A0ACC3Z897_COLTU|nr:leucine aminopeptidase [Colletotrichum truncatum]XP_036580930.1 leucine aminopeptidase [Colletotrichum truncatum]KAF6783615.1 leucine aminopeptidase [Colletotrichum truncatum]KAF6789103.1 leucine aminopeptidase [Colletotrichum truncatum]
MRFITTLAVAAASFGLASAAPASEDVKVDPLLRLIKTSEEDPGTWVTEDEKFEKYTSKGIGFIDITDITDEGVLSVLSSPSNDVQVSKVAARQAVTYPTTLTHVTEANSLITRVTNTGPQSWLKTLTDFHNRHYRSTYGTQASTWLYNQAVSIASGNSAITVTRFTHSAFNQPSIIVKYPGTSTNLVIVGAHFDSTAGSSTARSPGADDNGTGTVNLLEALRVLVAAGFKPKNTLEFHFYAGEEGGLLGSQAVFSNYRTTGKRVLGMLNQDMTGYSPGGRATVYTDYVDSAFTAYVRLIATQYTGATPSSSSCGYGCSDHASARSNGFPSAFVNEEPFSTSNPNIHTSRDTYESIQWNAVLRHSKLTVGFLVEASYL